MLDRRLLLVTGKGGVGKSSVAAALAWSAARGGKRVLACELDAKGDLAACLMGAGAPHPSNAGTRYQPDELHPRLWVMSMDPEASLKEYLRLNLRLPLVTKLGSLSTVFDFLAHAAPGVREIVTIGKVAWEVRERHFDLVVVDATATGHIVSQLRAPQAINELVGVGSIRGQTAWMLDILGDPAVTGLVVTTTLEEMPVTETLTLIDQLAATNVALAAVVVNRELPEVVSPRSFNSPARVAEAVGGPRVLDALREGVALAEGLAQRQQLHLERLGDGLAERGLDRDAVLRVPQIFDGETGLPMTRRIADELFREPTHDGGRNTVGEGDG